MGYYINPKNGQTKEEWLFEHSTLHSFIPPKQHRSGDQIIVCLVDNGGFTAAGICYSQDELKAFSNPDDYRPKAWFDVPLEKLREFLGDQEIE